MAPLYSFDPDTSGPGGGPGSMVLSIACAEGRTGECDAWFRCDHPQHRRLGTHSLPSRDDLLLAADRQFGVPSSPLPPEPGAEGLPPRDARHYRVG